MTNTGYIGSVDYSDLPILPPWYVPGWSAQNISADTVAAPSQPYAFNQLPSDITYVTITGNYDDGSGNWLGGFLTFEQSNDLLYGPDPSTGQYYRLPKRLVGVIPVPNILAFNWEGSGRVYIQFGTLNVMLMATDTPNMVIQEPYYVTQEYEYVAPVSWVYHVKEYFMGGFEYDIAPVMAQASAAVDINSLIIPDTLDTNRGWSPQWCS